MQTVSFLGDGVRTVFEVPGNLGVRVYVSGTEVTPASTTDSSVTLSVAPDAAAPVQIDYEVEVPQAAPKELRTTATASFVVPNETSEVILAGSGTLTVTLPVLPFDNQEVSITLETAHTAVTVEASAAHTIVAGAAHAVTAGAFSRFRFRAANAKWYRVG